MKFIKTSDDDVSFSDVNNFFIDNNILCIELDIHQHQELYIDMNNRREYVTMGDVGFITNLFEGKLVLDEEIFYKRTINYREYDDMDDGWREEDIRKYNDWKKDQFYKGKKKSGRRKSSPNLEELKNESIHFNFTTKKLKAKGNWIAFSKYTDDYWMIIGQMPEYRFWICDSRDGLNEFKKLNIF